MQSDTEKLTGVWDIVALETEGAKLSESLFIGSKIILNGASFTTVSMGATYSGSFTVDESKNPKTMDMTFTDGTHSGAKSLAIYELNGDEWKLCLCLAGGDRPLEFSTSPGDGHAFERLIRGSASQNSGMEEFAEPNTEQDISKLEGEWEMLYGERDGAMFPEGFIESGKRSQVAGLVTVSVGGQVILKATISADASTKPNSMNYSILGGPNKGKRQQGIYEVDGNMLRACFANPGKARPSQFTTMEGDELTFTVWKRLRS